MVAHKVKVAVLLLVTCSIEASVIAPAIAPIAYTRAVPYNVLPFANSVNVYTRTLSAPLLAAYPGIASAYVKTPLAPIPAVAPALAPVPAVAPSFGAVPAFSSAFGHLPAGTPAFAPAPAPAVVPGFKVSSFLPAPFDPAPPVFSAAPAVAAPVVKSLAPAPFAPAVYANPLNPAFGRSYHAVAPAAFPSPVIPGYVPAPIISK